MTKSLTHYFGYFSCVEAVAIAANISKHIKYLGSTIHYIADQVTANSSVLEIQVQLPVIHKKSDTM